MIARLLIAAALALASMPTAPAADSVLAARTIRAMEVLTAADVVVTPDAVPGALSDPAEAVGQEARANLYAGRAIRPGDLGPPAIVERNQMVQLTYHHAGLAITTEGRALGRGGVGEQIRVMNIGSRNTVYGIVLIDGSVNVAASR